MRESFQLILSLKCSALPSSMGLPTLSSKLSRFVKHTANVVGFTANPDLCQPEMGLCALSADDLRSSLPQNFHVVAGV